MEQKHLFASVVILVLIIVGMFAFAYIQKQEINTSQSTDVPIAEDYTETPYDYIERVDAKHFYIDGVHTIAGELNMPTQCDLLEWDTTIMESYPEQVIVDFSVINHSDNCTQVTTPQRFQVGFEASAEASIRARLMGREIEVNLIPAQDNETVNDFELFLKG